MAVKRIRIRSKPADRFHCELDSERGILTLSGILSVRNATLADRKLRRALAQVNKHAPAIYLDAGGIEKLDTAGALLLRRAADVAGKGGKEVHLRGLRPEHQALFDLIARTDLTPPPHPPKKNMLPLLLTRMGKGAIQAWHATLEIVEFLGQSTVSLAKAVRAPRHFRLASISRHLDETGIDAIPIIGMISFFTAVVLAYQGAEQLRPLGAQQYTVNLIGISVIREMAVLLTAIMVAGRSGSAFTAEIGVMNVREEVDALRVTGIDPFEVLVMPRLIALTITLPLLTFIAMITGLFGGAVICMTMLNIPLSQYMHRIHMATDGWDMFVGLIKAPVFAFLIAVVGCMHGMRVSGSAESVGTHTTASVVQSIFLVLVVDAIFSVIFAQIGI